MKKGILFGAIGGFVNGFFGTGGGTIMLYNLQKDMAEKKKANATCLSIILPLSIISIVIYIWNGTIDWWISSRVCVGAIIGSIVGARLLNTINYKIILWAYCAITIFGGISMIFRR